MLSAVKVLKRVVENLSNRMQDLQTDRNIFIPTHVCDDGNSEDLDQNAIELTANPEYHLMHFNAV